VAPRIGQAANKVLIRSGVSAPAPAAAAGGSGGNAPEALRSRCILVLVAGAGIFQVARWMDAEPLLACVTAGLVAANRR